MGQTMCTLSSRYTLWMFSILFYFVLFIGRSIIIEQLVYWQQVASSSVWTKLVFCQNICLFSAGCHAVYLFFYLLFFFFFLGGDGWWHRRRIFLFHYISLFYPVFSFSFCWICLGFLGGFFFFRWFFFVV